MSAAFQDLPVRVRSMLHGDLLHVADIERRSYEFPWNQGIFRDCLLAGYVCIALDVDDDLSGYGILSVAAGEAHILNLCVDQRCRNMGYGERLLNEMLERARGAEVGQVFLEVRPTNTAALSLYHKKGFTQIAKRPDYYQSTDGREDASVLSLKLSA